MDNHTLISTLQKNKTTNKAGLGTCTCTCDFENINFENLF